jgi:hypothetical protein
VGEGEGPPPDEEARVGEPLSVAERERRRAEQQARNRKRRKRRARRAALRSQFDWRGRPVPALGWWIAAVAVVAGVLFGHGAEARTTGGGDPVSAIGTTTAGAAVGVAWGALVLVSVGNLPAGLVMTVSVFVAAFLVGPSWPGALRAGTVSVVAGWMVGIHLRYLLVGRRRPPAPVRLVDRTAERRPAPLTKGQRTDLWFRGGGGAFSLLFVSASTLIRTPGAGSTLVVLLALALAWGLPTGWWTGMATSSHAVGGAPLVAASWGVPFAAWGAGGFGGTGVVLLGTYGALALGYVARRLYEARVGRWPRGRPTTPAGRTAGR